MPLPKPMTPERADRYSRRLRRAGGAVGIAAGLLAFIGITSAVTAPLMVVALLVYMEGVEHSGWSDGWRARERAGGPS